MAAARKTAKKAITKKIARKAAEKPTTRAATAGASAQLVVASKVQEHMRQNDARMSGEFLDAVSAEVDVLVSRAVTRAKDNGRNTVRSQDL